MPPFDPGRIRRSAREAFSALGALAAQRNSTAFPFDCTRIPSFAHRFTIRRFSIRHDQTGPRHAIEYHLDLFWQSYYILLCALWRQKWQRPRRSSLASISTILLHFKWMQAATPQPARSFARGSGWSRCETGKWKLWKPQSKLDWTAASTRAFLGTQLNPKARRWLGSPAKPEP